MDFSELAKARYSVRKFKENKVPSELCKKILEAANLAPTACNNQPQKIIAVSGDEALSRLRECTMCHFSAPLVFVICYDKRLCWYREDGRNSGDVDASIVTTHMALEAADLGLGTTMVMLFDEEKLKAELELDENLVPVMLLPTGYPAENVKPAHLHFEYRAEDEMIIYK